MLTSLGNKCFRQGLLLSAVIIAMLFLVAAPASFAAPSKLISYQGRVTDSNGQPLPSPPTSYNMRFRIYNTNATDCQTDTAGANDIWEEIWNGASKVQVTNGLFSAVLGSVTPFTTQDFNSDYWLQVTVDSNDDASFAAGEVFSPCDRLTTAPYAVRALDANSASSASNASACNADATCETQAISATGNISTSGYVDVGATGSAFLGRLGVEGNTGISCAGVATGSSGIWYADAGDCGTVFVGINTATNGSEVWGIWLGSWDWTIDVSGNVSQGGDLTVNGYDIDLIRGDSAYIHSVGRISFDWTTGTYDGPDYHGLTSKAESNNAVAGAWADDLSINSYSNAIVTIDSNNNSTSTFKVQNHAMAAGGGTDLLTLDESGNLTVTGTISGGSMNAYDCSADTVCTVQQINSGQGDTEVYLMNQNIRTTDGVTFGTVTDSGNLTVTGGTTTLNNATSNLIDFGSVGVAAPSAASAGWKIKTYDNSYGLGIESSTQWFSTGRYYKFYNSDGSTFWKNRITLDTDNTLTYPAVYAYNTAAAATLLEFKTGVYNNGGTFYSQNQMYARAGVANDDTTLCAAKAGTAGYLCLNDDVMVNGGWLRVVGSAGIYFQDYGGGWNMSDATWIRSYGSKQVYVDSLVRADGGFYMNPDSVQTGVCIRKAYSTGGDTACPTSYAALTLTDGGTNDGNWATATDPGAARTGYFFCCWMGSW